MTNRRIIRVSIAGQLGLCLLFACSPAEASPPLSALPASAAISTSQPAESDLPDTYFWDRHVAWQFRRLAEAHDVSIANALTDLRRQADAELKVGPFSVVDKTLVPPSGDRHDFSTLGRYYWPNPDKPDGMPWIRKDGQTNPEYFNGTIGDTNRFIALWNAVSTLSRAYYVTGERVYADRATYLFRVWFIDPATRMNPNAKYAARFPGNWDGKCYGIHGTRNLGDFADSVVLLRGSPSWTAEDDAATSRWFADYLTWLTTSDMGKEEGSQPNNHGTAYDCLVVRLALFGGDKDLARRILTEAKTKRIAAQVEPDGRMPSELARATPWRYASYGLEFLFKIASLGEQTGVDLWHYQSSDGRSIHVALDYLVAMLTKDASPAGPISSQLLTDYIPARFGPMLETAATVFNDQRYLDLARRIGWQPGAHFVPASTSGTGE